jgi:2-isopropylmalate synthase
MIFDTTLRDGEQCPGATMTFEEKLKVAERSTTMGVDIIEAGFPIASDGDFEAVSEIAKRRSKRSTVIAGLARAIRRYRPCRRGRAACREGRIHTFVSTSPIHLAHQMRKSQEQVLEIITTTVTQARNLVEDVEWSAMDATRTPIDYLCRCVRAAIKAGATTINLPDTVGYATPDEYYAMFKEPWRARAQCRQGDLLGALPQRSGLAVANSLAGIEGGARQVECTINGIGERAGNAALEEVVMALRVRGDVLPY